MKIILSNTEQNVINKIVRKTKMDCWFDLRYTIKRGYYVYDLEERKAMSIRTAIQQVIDGILDWDIETLSEKEKIVLIRLLARLI